jgi:hypothetical protein
MPAVAGLALAVGALGCGAGVAAREVPAGADVVGRRAVRDEVAGAEVDG